MWSKISFVNPLEHSIQMWSHIRTHILTYARTYIYNEPNEGCLLRKSITEEQAQQNKTKQKSVAPNFGVIWVIYGEKLFRNSALINNG